jgi:DNA mismatch repair protein MSH6
MGGKSTVLRQTCIAVVMAQVGCFVNADRAVLTPVDKIFTRVGANDSLVEGKSTFLIELEETQAMLASATSRSLAVLDELGRGTSTFDGTAIALAVLRHVALEIRARCLFATHYHVLGDEVKNCKEILNYHMDAMVDEVKQTVTFLYKFRAGLCPKSYGMNVARLAGLPAEVVQDAAEKSAAFEKETGEAHAIGLARAVTRSGVTDEELKALYASLAS